jgi:hypothetical protein
MCLRGESIVISSFGRSLLNCVLVAWVLAGCTHAVAQQSSVPNSHAAESFPVSVDSASGEFCLIMVPDTQRYAAYFPEIFRRQFRWIRDYVDELNVKFVMHVGDIVEEGEDAEWAVADESFAMLDGVVPYLAVPGNHDMTREGIRAGQRNSSKFNAVFSPKRFAGRSWYGGSKGVTSDNSFGYFEAGGQEFMVLGLEFAPTDETLAWANHLVGNHSEQHKVILVTHCYMYYDDTRLGEGDAYNPRRVNPSWNDGEQIWEKLVSRRDNFVMVLSGHVKGTGTGRLVSETRGGSPVLQMLANYQFLGHGGQGWLRILKFSPLETRLDVYTYSPWLNRFREEKDQRFSVDVPWMFPAAETVPRQTGDNRLPQSPAKQ